MLKSVGLALVLVTSVLTWLVAAQDLNPWLLAALLPVGAGLALAGFAYPELVTLLLAVLVPLDSLAAVVPELKMLTLFKLLFPLPLAVLFLRTARAGHIHSRLTAMDGCLLAWGLYNAVLVPLAADRLVALDTLRRFISMWLLYVVFSRMLQSERWLRRAHGCLIASATLSAVVGLAFYAMGSNPFLDMTDATTSNEVRISGAARTSPNDYATILFLPLFLSASAWVAARGRPRFFYGAATLLILAGVIFSFSRSASLVVAAVAVPFMLSVRRSVSWPRLAAAGLVLLALLPLLPGRYWQRLGTLLEPGSAHSDTSLWRRVNYLHVGTRIFRDHPLLGCGPGNFAPLHAQARYQPQPGLIGMPRKAHNEYLSVAVETGLLGLLLYSALMLAALREARRLTCSAIGPEGLARGLYFALLAYLGMGLFLHLHLHKSLWITLGLIRAVRLPSPAPSSSLGATDQRSTCRNVAPMAARTQMAVLSP